MIALTEKKASGAELPALLDPDDISAVGVDDTNPNMPTIIWMKSSGKSLWVTQSVAEVEEKINEARKAGSQSAS